MSSNNSTTIARGWPDGRTRRRSSRASVGLRAQSCLILILPSVLQPLHIHARLIQPRLAQPHLLQPRRPRAHRAFTLIELLVVIAIVSLLIAILLPSLASARAQGRKAVCLSNMRQISLAASMYADQNGDRFPIARGVTQDGGWIQTLQPYAKATLAYRCPADRSTDWFDARRPVSEHVRFDRKSSFGINVYLTPEALPPPGALDERPRFGFDRRGRIRYSAETIHFGERIETRGMETFADHIHANDWSPDLLTGAQLSRPELELALRRHTGKENYAYADGHADTRLFESTFALDPETQLPQIDFWNPEFRQQVAERG